MSQIESFKIEIPQAALDDLRERLERIRWPAEVSGADDGWVRGVPVGYLRQLADYWLHSYDWRVHEAALNEIPQFTTTIDGQRIHFLHVRSPHASAVPLLITHGWPGSFVEMVKLLEPLTQPADPSDAFHVVVPSLPGFGFSTPLQAGWHDRRIARAWHSLMSRLGYSRYGAHGGDTGSVVSPELGRIAPSHVIGVHIYANMDPPELTPTEYQALTPAERARLDLTYGLLTTGSGYGEIQGTKPATLAYGLTDSPVGQLAWIVEKFKEWTDPARPLPEDAVDVDQLLTNVSLYWLTGTGATSAQLYYESRVDPAGPLERSPVPTGIAVFPYDPAIRSWLDRLHTIVHWSEFDQGGHFAAMEVPDLLVEDLRAFFRKLR